MDLLSTKYYRNSSYSAFGSNPMKYIDPDGKRIYPVGPEAKAAMEALMLSFAPGNVLAFGHVFQLVSRSINGGACASTDVEKIGIKEFRRRVKAEGLTMSKSDLLSWYHVYEDIQMNKEIQVEVISANQSGDFTYGRGGGGAGTTYGGTDTHINGNKGLEQMREDAKAAGGVTNQILTDALNPIGGAGTGPYKPDVVGSKYSVYNSDRMENRTTNQMVIKTILYDGTGKTAQQIADIIKESLSHH